MEYVLVCVWSTEKASILVYPQNCAIQGVHHVIGLHVQVKGDQMQRGILA